MQILEQPTCTHMPPTAAGKAKSVLQRILEQKSKTPDAIALVCGRLSISYETLMERVERWAWELRRRNIGPESVAGVRLEKPDERVTAILAVLRAGGAYLPFDHAHPRSRCYEILRTSAATAIISDDAEICTTVPSITPAALDANVETGNLPIPDERQLAYVIYTSGSTGTPKGVAIEHGALLNHMLWMIEQFGNKAGARVIQRTSCMFDASVWEFFFSLMTGGTLVLDEANSNEPHALRTLLLRETATAMQCVPTYLRLALESGAFHGTCLNFIFVGGEVLGANLANSVRKQTNADVVNLYGPTETTIDATFFHAGDLGPSAGDSSPIGKPITSVWARTVTPDYGFAAEGTTAELWIGGAGVGRGYHRAAAMTASAFVPDPFTQKSGARAYRTGDLVKEEKGLLTFAGRADRLLKLKGFRVEPGEIEAALRQHPLIIDAIVLVKNTGETQVLVAYCLRRQEQVPDNEAVRSYLLERLPHYMVPGQFVWLDHFPVKSNGKLDMSALPEPAVTPTEGAPETETERILVGIYSKLFKRQVSVCDSFFDLGGDSIRSIQAISLAKQHGLRLRLQDIFECPTIRGLASRVIQSSEDSPEKIAFALAPKQDRPLLDPKVLEDAYPTGIMLDALYFLNETSPRYEIYVTSCELEASWDPEAFRLALSRTVERHPWLRTAFAFEGFSRPLQLVHKRIPIRWNFEDVRHLSHSEQERFLLQWIDREKTVMFEWREVPVWRISIHQWANDRFQITLSEPIFDGWSVSSFLGELITNYAAFQNGTPASRPKPRALYRDFIVAEQQSLQDQGSIAFWKQMTAGDVGRALPRWSPQPLEDRGGLRVEMRLGAEVSNSLRQIARIASAPLKSVLLAVHARVIGALTGRSRVISGVIMNGRAEGTDTEQVLGLHINTAPLALDLTARNWLELIRHVFEAEKSALPHRRYPMAAIQKMHGRTPLFEAAFNFTHFHGLGEYVRASGLKILRYLALDQTFFPFTAQFHVDVNDSSIGLGLDYDSTEFPTEQIEEIAALYRESIDQLIFAPEQSFKRALKPPQGLEAAEIHTHVAPHETALETFWRVVDERPDQIALTIGQHQISYAKLASMASSIGMRLRQFGVRDKSVLVCFRNQGPALIALLALMEAGGIYVPVDPEFPAARIVQIARNASAVLCLCEENTEDHLRECGLPTWTLTVNSLLQSSTGRHSAYRSVPPGPAYRIYTSGSTGVPKGVEVGPDALQHFLSAMRPAIGLTADDVVPGITTISFDISLLEMLLPITTGARLVALDREVCRDGKRLSERLQISEATCCQATPTTWRMLLETNATLPRGLKAISGGEALSADLAERLLACGVTLTNAYGPTETTIWSAAGRVRSAKAIRLGPPLGATTLRVSDAFLDDCLPGVTGEIEIGGDGVAHGYVGKPALTAERFIPSMKGNGQRCYRTGDLGRYSADGNIEFLGRTDHQVKLRGYRIELGEIEEALRGCPGVRSAVVTLLAGDRPSLVGYVVLAPGVTWDEKQIKRGLRNLLPEHMIPRYFVVMDSLPLTGNQKIDRSKLPAPSPESQNGRRVVEIFEQIKAMSAEDVRSALAGHP